MSDIYDKSLLHKLADDSNWIPEDFTEDFMEVVKQVDKDVSSNSISGKIASIFIKHQIIHEMIKDLITLSHLYLQGEIWPTRINPKYDSGKEKMTGWYIDYYESNCIECRGKTNFIKESKRLNEIRNKVAHNMAGKNEVVINSSYKEFEAHFQKAISYYNVECFQDLMWRLTDLTKRVDFTELIED